MGIQPGPRGRTGSEGMPCHTVCYSASLKAWEKQGVTFSGLLAQSHDLYDSSSCLVCGKWTRRLNSGPRHKCLITQAGHSGQVFRIFAWKKSTGPCSLGSLLVDPVGFCCCFCYCCFVAIETRSHVIPASHQFTAK